MQTRVWYDSDCSQIWVSDIDQSYAPRTLVATVDSDSPQMVVVKLKTGGVNISRRRFSDYSDQDGNTLGSVDDCLAYLSGEFAKSPSTFALVTHAVSSQPLPKGMPVSVSRQNGQLQIARADTYVRAFVAGLSSESAEQGFAASVTRDAITLDDWSPVAASTSLSIGQPYFLGLTGGITSNPTMISGNACVRVGEAASANTLVFRASDPVLL